VAAAGLPTAQAASYLLGENDPGAANGVALNATTTGLGGPNLSLIPTTNTSGQSQAIQRLFTVPRWKRLFDSHVLDIVASTANAQYLDTWATHLGAAVGTSLTGFSGYAQSRGNFALTQMPAAVPFEITTNGGADFTTPDSSVTRTGRAWVDVYSIYRNGVTEPLPVSWSRAVPPPLP